MKRLDQPEEAIGTPGQFADADATYNTTPFKPLNFRVTISPDGLHLLFTVKDRFAAPGAEIVSEYYIWYAPLDLLDSPSEINDPDVAERVFAGSTFADSIPTTFRADDVSKESDRRFVGRDGWFFAQTVSQSGKLSKPTPPVRAPRATTAADSEIPGDVSGAQAALFMEHHEGRAYVRVVVSAQVPDPIGSFAGYQIYLEGYRYNDFLVEREFFGIGIQEPGDSLTGTFLLEPDVPSAYNTGLIAITNGSTDIVGTGTNWHITWGPERVIEFYAVTSPSTTATIESKRIERVTSATTLSWIGSPDSYNSAGGLPYAIYSTDTQGLGSFVDPATGVQPDSYAHVVTMYFVSVSRGGTRREDITNAPHVTFMFGMGGGLSKPINPIDLAAAYQPNTTTSSSGSSVSLSWRLVDISTITTAAPTQVDSTVDHFNIRKMRQGTLSTPIWATRPDTIYATVPVDRTMNNTGLFTWVDKQFNTDPTQAATDDPDGWDFDPADPAQYVYYVTSVNDQGLENLTAYWGSVYVEDGSEIVIFEVGDPFVDDMDGATITIAGDDYTVESHPAAISGTLTATNGNATVTYATGDAFGVENIGQTIIIDSTEYRITARPTPTTFTITPVFASATDTWDFATDNDVLILGTPFVDPVGAVSAFYDYIIGPVTGRITLMGNSGAENDVTIYRDTFLNRLFNAQLRGTAGSTIADHATAFTGGAGGTVADGQPTYKNFFTGTIFTIDDPGGTAGTTGTWTATAASNPADPPDATNDKWTPWQYYTSGTGVPAVFTTGPGGGGTGELEIDTTAQITDDYSVITQLVDKSKFLLGENLVFRAFIKCSEQVDTAGAGLVKMQAVRYDASNYGNGIYVVGSGTGLSQGIERDIDESAWSVTTLLPGVYQTYTNLVKLPSTNPTVEISCSAISDIVTSSNADFTEAWIGCTLTPPGGSPIEIIEVTGGADKVSRTTIKLRAVAGVDATDQFATVTIKWTHYWFKMEVNGECPPLAPATTQIVTFKQPMVNGGLLGAPWTSEMNRIDWPGGADNQVDDPTSDPNDPRPGCVIPGTLIETCSGPRPIELCIPGTKVWSIRGTKKKIRNTVTHLNQTTARRLYTFSTTAHRYFVCSETHPIRVYKDPDTVSYTRANAIVPGDVIIVTDGNLVALDAIDTITWEDDILTPVYSLTLESGPHNYFAGSVLCHNKPPIDTQN